MGGQWGRGDDLIIIVYMFNYHCLYNICNIIMYAMYTEVCDNYVKFALKSGTMDTVIMCLNNP